MEQFDRKKHWETIYQTKSLQEVSWYQPAPHTSLELIQSAGIATNASIIDIGGGDSYLADHLLNLGYTNITVLDISNTAIQRAKTRLGIRANDVTWIEADAAHLDLSQPYDCWHDRAAFHFLTAENDIAHYVETAQQHITKDGTLIIGTFSEQGPKKCSGIEIRQYNEASLTALFEPFFEKVNCLTVDHQTPFNTLQNFIFCVFKRK